MPPRRRKIHEKPPGHCLGSALVGGDKARSVRFGGRPQASAPRAEAASDRTAGQLRRPSRQVPRPSPVSAGSGLFPCRVFECVVASAIPFAGADAASTRQNVRLKRETLRQIQDFPRAARVVRPHANLKQTQKLPPVQIPGGRKTVKSENGENLVFSRGGGVTSVTPFPFSSAHSEE